jgi:hypothetical protein
METSRTQPWNPAKTLAALLLVAMFGSGYAFSTTDDAVDVGVPPIPASGEAWQPVGAPGEALR